MIVRLRSLEFVNLTHATKGERLPDGGMRIFILDAQPSDLPPDDADRIRRRVADLDPEPLAGARPNGTVESVRAKVGVRERKKKAGSSVGQADRGGG
jgi:hypothetical protein